MSYKFLNLALRQRLLKRWSLMYSMQPESVLEHSAIVGILSFLVGKIAQQNGRDLDLSKMLSHALLHDISETITGDVVTPVKRSSDTLYAEFKALERTAEQRILNTTPPELHQAIEEAFNPGGIEQELVKACDIYSAYLKCRLEVAFGNSVEFGDALARMEEAVKEVCGNYPELATLHHWFGEDSDCSVDHLITSSQ
ncbi:5'-deoxynucleotidase [Ferrimonas sediminicola]|uniref:5'-deoxynucleotidase n=1 Tax=Ferrimonas sediminicola TaxID=2569538 RepID=A0A4U1BAM7_9GAMM|nr:5'-deoxynucleotidase [Ferrimonas sediminicola]TKB47750.1 5'-deoxynucleotidase [Ferrimonas sediminicola]